MEGQWVAEMTKRRELHNQLQDMVGSLRVACRVRPIKGDETAITIKQDGGADPKVVINYMGPGDKPAEKQFDFTHVYGPKSTQEQVFKDSAELMTSVLDGYNVCIFAYGQSGSGKTHTMDGSKEMPGLAPRAMERLFEVIKERDSASKHEVFISMLEIYNERIRDLLGDGKKQKEMNFSVQKDEVIGMMCPGLTSTGITDKEGAATAIALGNTNRSVGATNLNEQSSRSHMIVTLTVFSTSKVNGAQHVGKLSLVDLAGSERLEKTGAGDDPERMKEAQAINKSLSALGTVIAALAANDKHVPYRDSKLTHLLADSLGGNSKTLMLVACRGEPDNAPETINSLTFAARAKAVKLGKATQRAAPKGPAKAKK
jgi:kinesin family protein C2/C3